MTDEDYIRKAVELAGGWILQDDAHGRFFIRPPFGIAQHSHRLGRAYKDALAAQLVRQVDALSDREYHVDVSRDECWVGTCDSYDGIHTLNKVAGPDRTMNTIRAIVDSGVLE